MPDLWYPSGGAILDHGVSTAASGGVTVTGSGTLNAKGSWSQIIASMSAPAASILVSLQNLSTARALVDIGIGGAGSEVVVIPDLFISGKSTQQIIKTFTFPLRVRAGSRIAARLQGNIASAQVRVSVHAVAPTLDSALGLSRVEACGVVTASTRGTNVDPGAVAHTKGSWVQMLAASAVAYKHCVITAGFSSDTTASNADYLIDIGAGSAGNEDVVFPNLPMHISADYDDCWETFSLPVAIAAGRRIAVRVQSSLTASPDRVIDLAMYGVG